MRIKLGLKIGLSSIFIATIIVIGYVVFKRLSHDKEVFHTDLYTHIPSEVTGILQINRSKNLKSFTSCFPELENIILSLEGSLSYPILLAEQKKEIYLISKVTSEQESKIKSILKTNLFPSFAPKSKTYKDATIYFYPTEGNRFFSCVFYRGFFMGGYNYSLLEKFVDTDSSNNIFSNKQATEIAKRIKTSYLANLYFNNKTDLTSFNIDLDENRIEFEGVTNSLSSENFEYSVTTENDSIRIDYSIFPDSLISYTISTNSANIPDTLANLFKIPTYRFILNKDQKSPIYAIKHIQNRFEIYNRLNKLEIGYIQRKFSTKDVVLGRQHIYTTSAQMGKEIFQRESSVYLTFFKNYLLISEDRNILIEYLKKNGQYQRPNSLAPIYLNTQIVSMFYSKNIQDFSPRYLDNYYLIKKITKGETHIKNYLENDEKRIQILSNN